MFRWGGWGGAHPLWLNCDLLHSSSPLYLLRGVHLWVILLPPAETSSAEKGSERRPGRDETVHKRIPDHLVESYQLSLRKTLKTGGLLSQWGTCYADTRLFGAHGHEYVSRGIRFLILPGRRYNKIARVF